jgi:hypothetical protein
MAMAHVFAQAHIRDHDQLGTTGLDRTNGLLHDPAFRVGEGCLLVFFFRNAEEQDGLQSEIAAALCLLCDVPERELEYSRHAGDRFPGCDPLADKKRQNEVVRTKPCLADEISQAGAAPQAARPMNQFSHRPRLNVTPERRKPCQEGECHPTGELDVVERSR